MDTEVNVGEVTTAGKHDNLLACGIGSCVVITLYDPQRKIGVLGHAMLPGRPTKCAGAGEAGDPRREDAGRGPNPAAGDARHVEVAMDQMLAKMSACGARKQDLEAKVVGGANMFPTLESHIGEENVATAKARLKEEHIALAGESTLGSMGRSVEFSIATGTITVKMKL